MKKSAPSSAVKTWTAIPGIGPATAGDLVLLGYADLAQLKGKRPLALYRALCKKTGERQDPCVLDVFMMLVHLAETGETRAWWSFTTERKRRHPDVSAPPRRVAKRPVRRE